MRYVKLPKQPKSSNKKNSKFQKLLAIMVVLTVIMFMAIIFAILSTSGSVIRFVFKEGSPIESDDNKVNVLLLGNAGGSHDGAYLTDTILVASYNLKTNQAYLISLPRDLWIDQIKGKINAVYEIGQEKNDGLKFSKQVIGDLLGIPIHYSVRVDFNGFIKAVDLLSGIDVEVERSFDDYNYPITGRENDLCGFKEEEKDFSEDEAKKLNIEAGKRKVLIAPDGAIATDSADPIKGPEYFKCRFEHIQFTGGITLMDGETALKFVRSRMGTNSEGSDFARSRRQQKVIESFRKKALSLETLSSPQKISGLIDTFGKSIEMDIPLKEIPEFYNLTKKIEKTTSFVVDDRGKDALLFSPSRQEYGGAYVLAPKTGNFTAVQSFVKKILKGEVNEASATARTSSN